MSVRKNKIANSGKFFTQIHHPFQQAYKLGVIASESYSGIRRDVPDSKKNTIIITSRNGGELDGKWVGHIPNKLDDYHREERNISGKIVMILVRNDLWCSTRKKAIVEETIIALISRRDIIL